MAAGSGNYAAASTPACRSSPAPPAHAAGAAGPARRRPAAGRQDRRADHQPGRPAAGGPRDAAARHQPTRPAACRRPRRGATRGWSGTCGRSWTRPRIRCGRPASATPSPPPPPAAAPSRRRGRRLRGVADAIASSFAVYAARNRLAHRARMRAPGRGRSPARRLGAGSSPPPRNSPASPALPARPDRRRVWTGPGAKPMPPPVAVPTGGRDAKVLGDAEVGGHAGRPAGAGRPVSTCTWSGRPAPGRPPCWRTWPSTTSSAGRGTVVIDPHGDLVLDILDRLPATVADRVVLFDPDQPNPPALNPLDGDDHDLVVDNLVSIFGSIFAKAWGPRMDDVMRVACLTLLKHANVTLQHIPPLLNSAAVPVRDDRRTWTTRKACTGSGSGTTNSPRRCGPRSSARSWPGCGRSCCATSSSRRCGTPGPASTWAGSSTAGCCCAASPKASSGRKPSGCWGR